MEIHADEQNERKAIFDAANLSITIVPQGPAQGDLTSLHSSLDAKARRTHDFRPLAAKRGFLRENKPAAEVLPCARSSSPPASKPL